MNNFDLSNRLFKMVGGFLIVLAIYFAFSIYVDYKTIPENNIYPEVISVSGEGKASIVPDVAWVNLGITTEGNKVETIVKTNSEKMNAIIEQAKALGIDEKDLKTKSYSLYPRYEWTETGNRIAKGYTLTQTIEVKIRDFSKIGNVLEVASQNGVTNVGELTFSIEDLEKAKSIAREKAINQAKEKANLISKQTGLKFKKITSIYENNEAYPYQAYDSSGMGGTASFKEMSSSVAPAIQTGQQEITVKITLNYRVK